MILKKIRKNILLKRILMLLFKYKIYIFIVLLLTLIFISINIIKPYILSLLFDVGIEGESLNDVYQFTFWFFLIMIFSTGLSITSEYVNSNFANKFIYDIRILVIEKMLDLPSNFFNNSPTGDIITRLDDDIQDIRNYLLFEIMGFYQTILNFIGASIFISIMQWRMLVANLLILPLLAFVLQYFRKILYKISMEVKKALSASNQDLVEGFKNINELKATNFELYFLNKLSSKFRDLLKKSVKMNVVNETSSSFIQLVVNFSYLITVGYGGYLILNGYMSTGMLLAFLTMRSQLVAPVKSFSSLYSRYFTVKASLERLENYYNHDIEDGIDIPNNLSLEQVSKINLRFQDVYYNYENRNGSFLINNFNYSFDPGRWIGIKGPSGIGKTTLVKIILKLITPNKGNILVNDTIRLKDINNRQWRDQISYVSQKTFAFNASVKENILMGRENISDKKIWEMLKVCKLDEEVANLPQGIDTNISENGSIFSTGMLKRLMLSRVILVPKKILLLDEFFSSLDMGLSLEIINSLKNKLPKDSIVVLISHRDSDFELCDEVIEFRKDVLKNTHEIAELDTH